jgi:dTDP-4-amino-4,6-dideoxygalactose transaminase
MSPIIAQSDPRAEYLACQEQIDAAIQRVLQRGQYILGDEVVAFENEFAAYLGARHAVGVATGTDALLLALRACGIGAGDEVITVSHTAVATVAAIIQCGARPVLVDVDPITFTLDPARLKEGLTPRTRAIIPVHLYGLPADLAPILVFAKEHGLRVIEDCAQAHGAQYQDPAGWRKAGTFGEIAAFSFYPTKPLGAIGDGGCVVTSDSGIAEKVRLDREYGWKTRQVAATRGWNSRLDEIQAAILRVKLKQLDGWNEHRRTIAGIYDHSLQEHSLVPPGQPANRQHVFHQYVLRVPNRDRVRSQLAAEGVTTGIHYPMPIHLQPAYRTLGEGARLMHSEALSPEILSLPMHSTLEPAMAEMVIERLAEAVKSSSGHREQ